MADDGKADDKNDDGKGGAGDKGTGDGKTYTEADIAGLKNKNSELLGSIRELKDKVKQWEGKDPAKVDAALKQIEEIEAERKRSEGKFDELKIQLNETHKKEIADRDARVTRVTGKLYEVIGKNEALRAIAKAEGNATLLMPYIERHLRIVEEGEDYEPRIVDEKGKERLGPKGDPLTVEEFVLELAAKDEFAGAFKMPIAGGSGKGPEARRTTHGGVIKLTREEGLDRAIYQAAKARADKEGLRVEIATT